MVGPATLSLVRGSSLGWRLYGFASAAIQYRLQPPPAPDRAEFEIADAPAFKLPAERSPIAFQAVQDQAAAGTVFAEPLGDFLWLAPFADCRRDEALVVGTLRQHELSFAGSTELQSAVARDAQPAEEEFEIIVLGSRGFADRGFDFGAAPRVDLNFDKLKGGFVTHKLCLFLLTTSHAQWCRTGDEFHATSASRSWWMDCQGWLRLMVRMRILWPLWA